MHETAKRHWNCSYFSLSGARANATFASVQQAKRFAEGHAGLEASPARWVQTERGWLLRLITAEYIVTPAVP